MNFSNRYHQLAAALIFAVCSSVLSSCVEKISTIGSDYVQDSVLHGNTTFSESAVLQFSPVEKQILHFGDRSFNVNYGSPYLFFGSVAAENMQAWAVLKMPLLVDSVGQVLTDSLFLRMKSPYYYNPSSSSDVIDFFVYVETGHKTTDSAGSLSISDLNPTPVAHYVGTKPTDSLLTVTIGLDTAVVNPLLRTTALAFVIVPGPTMSGVRGFASTDNGDVTYAPYLKMNIKSGGGVYSTVRYPEYDYHIVTVPKTVSSGMFELRGSVARRERIVINTKEIRTRLGLSPYTTINKALIQLTSDPTQRTTSTSPVDSIIPYLSYVNPTIGDSLQGFLGEYFAYATRLSSDKNVLNYQIQTYIEYAMRHNLDSMIFELKPGFGLRTINSVSTTSEDYNVNRWMFYNIDAADITKRPKLVITYSYLK